MSLSVRHLTKVYGKQLAVLDASFEVHAGEIVGFLGPNGAGKSTTMKVATTYIPPTEGSVLVDGWDVTQHPMNVKRIIGYLPEHNPLYADMYVHEYLRFIGRLYGLRGATLKRKVEDMVDQCGLTLEQHKKIGTLSKGFRQRVGLAQALIHDPRVLILDEPTSGLDPNQLAEIRKLIREISKDKTVIFSTHIMQEVQALCDRVIVINKGRVVADDRLANLMSEKAGSHTIVVEFEKAVPKEDLSMLTGVSRVDPLSETRFRITSTMDVRSEVFRFATEKSVSLVGLQTEESSLEDVFRMLTANSDQV